MKKYFEMGFKFGLGWYTANLLISCAGGFVDGFAKQAVREIRNNPDSPTVLKKIFGDSKNKHNNKSNIEMGFRYRQEES